MSELQTYFDELAIRDGKPAIQILPWDPNYRKQFELDCETSIKNCAFNSSSLIIAKSASKQTVGNKMAKFFTEQLNARLQHFNILGCPGSGYPDRCLLHTQDKRVFALELKATCKPFDPNDKNRMVLVSASDKLRSRFADPVSHLLVVVCYRRIRDAILVYDLGFEFFQPWSPVNIRLEASTSPALLSSDSKGFIWIHANKDDATSAEVPPNFESVWEI